MLAFPAYATSGFAAHLTLKAIRASYFIPEIRQFQAIRHVFANDI